MRVVREEIFGPVMSVLTFADEAEAIARAIATNFGLSAGLMTRDLARGHRVAAKLESGNVWINTYNLLPPGLPFSGVKHSGFGRENSHYSLDAYSEVKTTYVQLKGWGRSAGAASSKICCRRRDCWAASKSARSLFWPALTSVWASSPMA